jgi:hypothetical protein
MAKKPFFYDDCRSGDRLAREWTRIVGVDNLTVEYQTDIGRFAYTITRAGAGSLHQWNWMVAPSMVNFESVSLFKKNSAAPNASSNGFGLLFDSVDTNNVSDVAKTDAIYFGRRASGVYYYKYWNMAVTNDIWYYWKVRKVNRDVRLKFWQYGTAEPDWQYTQTSPPPTSSNENPVRYQPHPNGKFGIQTFLFSVGDWAKIADIRITPIPRTGGP